MEFAVADILGGDWVFTLNENGSCDMTLLDEAESGDWDETETGFSIEDEFMFTVENGVAVLDYEGITLTFEQQ